MVVRLSYLDNGIPDTRKAGLYIATNPSGLLTVAVEFFPFFPFFPFLLFPAVALPISASRKLAETQTHHHNKQFIDEDFSQSKWLISAFMVYHQRKLTEFVFIILFQGYHCVTDLQVTQYMIYRKAPRTGITEGSAVNTLRPRQNGRHFIDDIFKCIFSWMKMFEFQLKFHWSLFLRVQLTIFHDWFR